MEDREQVVTPESTDSNVTDTQQASIADVADDLSPEEPKAAKKPNPFKALRVATKENHEYERILKDDVLPTMKAMQEEINSLRAGGASKDEIQEFAEEQGLDPEQVKGLVKLIQSKVKPDDKILSDLKEIKESNAKRDSKEAEVRIMVAIDKEFDRVTKDNPQLAKVANKDFIKKHLMDNQDDLKRPMDEVLEEVYGNAVKDGGTVDGYSPTATNHAKPVNYLEDTERVTEARLKGDKKTMDAFTNELIGQLEAISGGRRS